MLYLIAHAHTRADRDVDAVRWQLSAPGRRQAEALARQPFWDEVAHVVVSAEPKARLTVEPLLQWRALPLTVDSRFDELKRTGWIEAYAERVAEVFARPRESVGGWESAGSALARFQAGIADLQERFPAIPIALVGHGLTLSLYRAHLLGQDRPSLEDWQRLSFAAVARVNLEQERLEEDFRLPPGVPEIKRG